MPRLAIFDIDGTITDTNEVDDECFRASVAEVFALDVASLDWSLAPHVTDSALAQWLVERQRGHPPDPGELLRLVACFVELLSFELLRTPERLRPIEGTRGLVPCLRAAGWHVAIDRGLVAVGTPQARSGRAPRA